MQNNRYMYVADNCKVKSWQIAYLTIISAYNTGSVIAYRVMVMQNGRYVADDVICVRKCSPGNLRL